jgi:hypothetical protein
VEDELGQALAAMHRARAQLTTLECTLWTWTDVERRHRALQRVHDEPPAGTSLVIRSQGPGSALQESEHQIWFAAPDRCREEGTWATVVRAGAERWSISSDAAQPVVHQDQKDDDPLGSIAHLVDPRGLPFVADLEVAGGSSDDGRRTVVLRGRPRSLHDTGTMWVAGHRLLGGDELRADVDLETGLVVRLEQRLDGEAFHVEELRGVRTGHRISAARFLPELPEDREVISPAELMTRRRAEVAGRPMGRANRGPRMPSPHHHEPTGPPPADEAEATLAIQRALNSIIGPHEQDVPGLEGGEGLASTLQAARQRSQEMVGVVTSLRLDHVRFLHARLADIRCSVVSAGRGSGLQFSGFAFEQDGEWLVSRETVASLVGLAGVRLPPRTVGLDASG